MSSSSTTSSSSSSSTRTDRDEMQQNWLLSAPTRRMRRTRRKTETYVDLGCVVLSCSMVKWIVGFAMTIGLVIGVTDLSIRRMKETKSPIVFDDYWKAAKLAMLFFDAQKSGYLPKNSTINKSVPWRGDSCVTDGFNQSRGRDLIGGYYDGGSAMKFSYPMSFSITLLSWSAIEYSSKYSYAGELDHIKDLIKWGTDYLLKTFDSSNGLPITEVTSQVGDRETDLFCWERPEDIDYTRPVQECSSSCTDLASEMAAALASASIVFRDDISYSEKLIHGAEKVYGFGRDRVGSYSRSSDERDAQFNNNSTGYEDDSLWGAVWLFYATGKIKYLQLATADNNNPGTITSTADGIFSWDRKLLASQILLTRYRMFMNPGYPYEEQLNVFHKKVDRTMCSYLPIFKSYPTTNAGLVQFTTKPGLRLEQATNAAFLASIFSDYMDAVDLHGWFCGSQFYPTSNLRNFAKSQLDYILGNNPMNISYIVGYGDRYPTQVHHRGASIPVDDSQGHGCRDGWRWRDSSEPNPNNITGAMVAGPDSGDGFRDLRNVPDFTGVSISRNAGLVSALISLSKTAADAEAEANGSGRRKWVAHLAMDRNTIFYRVPDLSPPLPSSPAPWKP